MRKLFTFFAALLVAWSASAGNVTKITTTSPHSSGNNLRQAIATATSGDTIEMAAGTYIETGNWIAFDNKEITVRAAEGEEVIIKPQFSVRVQASSASAKAEFIGVKFDCSALTSSELIVPSDNYANQNVSLKDCEIYNWSKNSALIHSTSTRKLDVIDIDNCYFHGFEKSIVFIENTSLVSLNITNSTFANVSADSTNSYWAAPIYVKATTGSVLVDHCTFYNVNSMSLTYGVVSVDNIPNSIVSNCIFVLPATMNKCATNLKAGGNVKNTLTYNYDNWQPYGHYNTATVTDCVKIDPLFVDTANCNLTLSANSPALTAGTDGGAIGDPRWWPRKLYLKPGVWNAAGAKFAVYSFDGELLPAKWSAFMTDEDEDGIYEAVIPADHTKVIFARINGDLDAPEFGDGKTWNQTGDLTLVDGKDAYIITDGAAGYWSTYVPALADGYYFVGTPNDWIPATGDIFVAGEAEGEYTITKTLSAGDTFKAVSVAGKLITGYYPDGTDNEYLVTDWTAGEKTIYFRPTYNDAWGGHFYVAPNAPVVTYSDIEIDLRSGQLGTEGSNLKKYLTVADPYVYSDAEPFRYNAILTAASFNGSQHGYVSFVATIPVEAGNYKITVGNCEYQSNPTAVFVKNAETNEALSLIDANGQDITSFSAKATCYHSNTSTNISSAWFVAAAAQTIKIIGAQYTPYIKVEQVESVPEAVTVYTATFANAEGATGALPATLENQAPDTEINLPKNFTMYKEGYTLTGWSDGENEYEPGATYTINSDVTFTAVYTENTASLASRPEAVTIKWLFSQQDGVAPINVSGAETFVVAQATIGGSKIDVKLPVDATNAKLANSANSWTQINPGIKFSIPSDKGAVITYKQYDAGETTTPQIDVTGTDASYELTLTGTSGQLYIEYIQVVLPKTIADGISDTEASAKAVKTIEDGQLVIIKNGVRYNVLGAAIR